MKKLTQMITMMILIAAISIIGQIPTDGLVAYFPFNGNYNDESGNGNDLDTGLGGSPIPTIDRFGNESSAYELDGMTQIFRRSDEKLPSGNPEITISAWIIRKNAGNPRTIISWGKTGVGLSNEIVFYHLTKNGRYCLGLTNGADSVDTIADFPDDEDWSHVAVAINNSSVKLYLDGNPILSNNLTFNIELGSYLGIGTDLWNISTGVGWFAGIIDDIAIYNRALTDAEIKYLYGCNSSMNATPTFTSIPITFAKSGDRYAYNVITNDDGNVSLSLASAPTGMILNDDTLEWEPTNDDAGTHTVTITATDNLGSSSIQSYELTVEPTTKTSKTIIPQTLQVNNKNAIQYLPNGRICKTRGVSGLFVSRGHRRVILR